MADKSAEVANLYHSKDAFKTALSNAPAHEHPALGVQHGWHILDITCSCGNTLKDHVVDTRSKIEDDLRVKGCLKCGARGAWTYAKAVKPPAPIKVKESEKTADA